MAGRKCNTIPSDFECSSRDLCENFQRVNVSEGADLKKQCPYDFLCVIDFEATCDNTKSGRQCAEIIEFPAVLVDVKLLKIVKSFHSFVKPVLNCKLSNFCTEFTGITQEQVNKAQTFPTVFEQFKTWLRKNLGADQTCMFLFDGNSDVLNFMAISCIIHDIEFPSIFYNWINVKRVFCEHMGRDRQPKLIHMINTMGLKFTGNQHSGIDDAYNIASLAISLIQAGAKMESTEQISLSRFAEKKSDTIAYIRKMNFPWMKAKNKYKSRNCSQPHDNIYSYTCDVDPELQNTEKTLSEYKRKK